MSIRARLLLLVAVLAAGGLWWWLGSGPLSDEERVQAVITQALDGARDADLGAVMSTIAEDYEDADGVEKNTIRGLLFREFSRRGPVGIMVTPVAVVIEGDTATASFEAVLTEGAEGTIWPAEAEVMWFEVRLDRREGQWLIVSHRRGRILGE